MSRFRTDYAASKAYHHLYDLQAWRGPNGRRIAQLKAEPFCRMCLARGVVRAATVADHIEKHEGDLDKFLNNELQSLCATDHSSVKQRIEKGGRGYSSTAGLDGFPLDPDHPFNMKR